MKHTTKRTYIIYILVAVFFLLLGYMSFSFVTKGDDWVSHKANKHVYENGRLTVAGTVYDRKGAVLAETKDGERVYNESSSVRKATLHVLGDTSGYIATGIQNLYHSNLLGYNILQGIYPIKSGKDKGDITLTVDATVSKAAYEAMNGKKGTVIVYNYKTGQVVCMVSAPTYDPQNKPSPEELNTEKYDGVYLNRAVSGVFTPGSTFKTITAIAAIENIPDALSRTFTCKGKYETPSGTVICNGTHGKLTLEGGFNVSCNCVFAELAIELGPDIMTQTVRDLGLTTPVTVSRATTVRSSFDVRKTADVDMGWAGIGQYTTLVNPTQMLLLMGAIANEGSAVNPYLVEDSSEIINTKGQINSAVKLSPETANTLKRLMRSNVVNHYSDKKFPDLQICGKTGTAEVMNERSHAWFVGFSQRSDFPYAFVVCLENGGAGYNDAIPVANKTLQALRSCDGL